MAFYIGIIAWEMVTAILLCWERCASLARCTWMLRNSTLPNACP